MKRPVHRLTRLLSVLAGYPALDADALAASLGTTPGQIRRDLRDLRDAGAFHGDRERQALAHQDRTLAEAGR